MAQAGGKKRAAANSAASSKTTKSGARPQEVAEGKAPRRREIMAIVCFVLGAFSFIGFFDAEPIFISFFTGFVMGLIGYGFFALGPALIMCSVILLFHKGRPVVLRAVCTMLLPIFFGALVHLFASTAISEVSFAMFPLLWSAGAQLESGGIISGTIAELFMLLFGSVGTAIILILGTGILVFVVFKTTISRIIETYRNRPRQEYIPQPQPPTQPPLPIQPPPQPQSQPQPIVTPIVQPPLHTSVNKKQYKHAITPSWKKRKIDIPVDEDGVPIDHFEDDEGVPDHGYFKRKPDEAEKEQERVVEREEAHDEPNKTGSAANDDMPLDIPFMEGKMRRPPPLIPPIMRERFMATEEFEPASPEEIPEHAGEPEPTPKAEPSARKSPPKPKTAPEDFSPTPPPPSGSYAFPPLSLLSKGDPRSRAGDSEVKLNTERLESAFHSFGVSVKISNATRGPSVTRYEAELEAGVKLSKLTNLADDIALSLGTVGVRIAAMPNRISTVGIEVPNKDISKVHLRDVLESKEFSTASSKLSFTIGMDITGDPIIGDVSKLPHMLVAGTTGSGKSVCLNSIILSILYKASPDDVRFIMIDPKMVEFKVYNDIPHLLVPVVTDAKKAAGALQWATFEMMKRYKLFSETNARDLAGYNEIVRNSDDEREPLPQVVVVIDELADLMMLAAKEVEESICRVAQMGRASGIHLIIATQSPRADVITGLMKANIPSRIAFKVSSALESRIILDSGSSADKLVGYGDMLYAPTGAAKPMRLQGTWVSDSEREAVIDYIKGSGQTQYSEEVMGEIEKAAVEKSSGDKSSADSSGGGGDEYDELLPQAVDVILETGQASVSLLQRRLKLGYSRAARIVDQMEELGVVGPFEGSKPRALLVTREQWRQMQYVSGTAPADSAEIPLVSSVSEE